MASVQEMNREVADMLCEEAKRDPKSPYAGKFVGIANGQIVVVTDDLNELGRGLRQADSNPDNTFWVEVGRDYDEVVEIWETC